MTTLSLTTHPHRARLSRTRLTGTALAAVLSVALAACGASTTAPPSTAGSAVDAANGGGGTGGAACRAPCVTFAVQVNFTGADNVQGSFTDNTNGSGYSSCADFAKGDSVGFVQGPGMPAGSNTMTDGKPVSFLFHVAKGTFHGPDTYSGSVLAGGGPTIGIDVFFDTATSSYTISGDGSGHASFTGATGTAAQPESGTITWTCS